MTQSLHIGNIYHVISHGLYLYTSELLDLNLTNNFLGTEPVVNKAGFANGKIVDLTDPKVVLVEAE